MQLLGISNGKVLVGYNAGWPRTPRGVASFDIAAGVEEWYYQIGPANGLYSVADMDANGVLDLTMNAATVHNGVSGNGTTDGDLYLVVVDESGAGQLSQKYPSPSNGSVKHIFADMDNDGTHEIVGLEEHDPTYYPGTSQIHIYDTTGATLHSFDGPNNTGWAYAVGDLDGDGVKEVVASAKATDTTYVLSSTLQKLREVSVSGTVQLVCDLTGNGSKEVVLLATDGTVSILNRHLEQIAVVHAGSQGGRVIASDVDADGIVELLCMTDKLYVFSFASDDTDWDRLHDAWEEMYFGSVGNCAPGHDPDGDGHDNQAEQITGMDPIDRASCFAVTDMYEASGHVIEWPCVRGRYYDILWCSNLVSGFEVLESNVEYPQNSYTDTLHEGESQGFYKVEVRMK